MTARSSDGAVHVHGNRYWVPELARALAGKPADRRRVVVRYDATDLTRPAVVEELDGRLIARAELRTAAPVLDADSAKQIERERKRAAKLDREQLEIHRSLSTRELVAMVDAAAGTEAQPKPPAMAKVITGAFGLESPEPPAERQGVARGHPDPGGREGRGRGIAVTRSEMRGLLAALIAQARAAEDFRALYEGEEGEPWPGEAVEELIAGHGPGSRRKIPPAFYLGQAFFAEAIREFIEGACKGELKEHSNGN